MKAVFADSFYFLAQLNPKDDAHSQALQFTASFSGRLISTAWVMVEVADAFLKPLPGSGRFRVVLSSRDRGQARSEQRETNQ